MKRGLTQKSSCLVLSLKRGPGVKSRKTERKILGLVGNFRPAEGGGHQKAEARRRRSFQGNFSGGKVGKGQSLVSSRWSAAVKHLKRHRKREGEKLRKATWRSPRGEKDATVRGFCSTN